MASRAINNFTYLLLDIMTANQRSEVIDLVHNLPLYYNITSW